MSILHIVGFGHFCTIVVVHISGFACEQPTFIPRSVALLFPTPVPVSCFEAKCECMSGVSIRVSSFSIWESDTF